MRPLRIAIAEDNWLVAEYLCGELAALGHAIVGRARTGEELIHLVDKIQRTIPSKAGAMRPASGLSPIISASQRGYQASDSRH
jgi:hypothetical protein